MHLIYLYEELMHMLTDDYLNINTISFCTVDFFLVIDASLWSKKQLVMGGMPSCFLSLPKKEALCNTGHRNGSNQKEWQVVIVHEVHSIYCILQVWSFLISGNLFRQITVQNLKRSTVAPPVLLKSVSLSSVEARFEL